MHHSKVIANKEIIDAGLHSLIAAVFKFSVDHLSDNYLIDGHAGQRSKPSSYHVGVTAKGQMGGYMTAPFTSQRGDGPFDPARHVAKLTKTQMSAMGR